jgi:hypothetical protein
LGGGRRRTGLKKEENEKYGEPLRQLCNKTAGTDACEEKTTTKVTTRNKTKPFGDVTAAGEKYKKE